GRLADLRGSERATGRATRSPARRYADRSGADARDARAVCVPAGGDPAGVCRGFACARAEPGEPGVLRAPALPQAGARAAARDADPAPAPVPARRAELRDPHPAVGLAR